MARANATKRRRLTSANVIPSGFKRPVEAIPRPRPHMTFSLKSGNNAAPSRSKTTRRSEFEPRSMTPIRSAPSCKSQSDIGSAHDEPRVTAPEPLASPGQARIGHEIGMGRERFITRRHPLISPRSRQAPALEGITKIRHHDFVEDLPMHG